MSTQGFILRATKKPTSYDATKRRSRSNRLKLAHIIVSLFYFISIRYLQAVKQNVAIRRILATIPAGNEYNLLRDDAKNDRNYVKIGAEAGTKWRVKWSVKNV